MIEDLELLKQEVEYLKMEHAFWTKEIRDLEELLVKKFAGPYIEFEVHLAEHCNLNCQGCDHFAPLAEPEFADYEVFCRDMSRMAELFGADVRTINLLGGEPLLNPDVNDFMTAARARFSNSNRTTIRLVTNGILLPSKDEAFWECCRDNNICVAITKYPIDLDYNQIMNTAKNYGVEACYYNPTSEEKTLYRVPLKMAGDLDARRSFYKCFSANCCCFLKKGKLYTCTLIPNICHFNKFFGTDLPVTDEDSIDIYQASGKEEIFTFLSRPRRFCRFCDSETRVYGLKWQKSSKNITEWMATDQ